MLLLENRQFRLLVKVIACITVIIFSFEQIAFADGGSIISRRQVRAEKLRTIREVERLGATGDPEIDIPGFPIKAFGNDKDGHEWAPASAGVTDSPAGVTDSPAEVTGASAGATGRRRRTKGQKIRAEERRKKATRQATRVAQLPEPVTELPMVEVEVGSGTGVWDNTHLWDVLDEHEEQVKAEEKADARREREYTRKTGSVDTNPQNAFLFLPWLRESGMSFISGRRVGFFPTITRVLATIGLAFFFGCNTGKALAETVPSLPEDTPTHLATTKAGKAKSEKAKPGKSKAVASKAATITLPGRNKPIRPRTKRKRFGRGMEAFCNIKAGSEPGDPDFSGLENIRRRGPHVRPIHVNPVIWGPDEMRYYSYFIQNMSKLGSNTFFLHGRQFEGNMSEEERKEHLLECARARVTVSIGGGDSLWGKRPSRKKPNADFGGLTSFDKWMKVVHETRSEVAKQLEEDVKKGKFTQEQFDWWKAQGLSYWVDVELTANKADQSAYCNLRDRLQKMLRTGRSMDGEMPPLEFGQGELIAFENLNTILNGRNYRPYRGKIALMTELDNSEALKKQLLTARKRLSRLGGSGKAISMLCVNIAQFKDRFERFEFEPGNTFGHRNDTPTNMFAALAKLSPFVDSFAVNPNSDSMSQLVSLIWGPGYVYAPSEPPEELPETDFDIDPRTVMVAFGDNQSAPLSEYQDYERSRLEEAFAGMYEGQDGIDEMRRKIVEHIEADDEQYKRTPEYAFLRTLALHPLDLFGRGSLGYDLFKLPLLGIDMATGDLKPGHLDRTADLRPLVDALPASHYGSPAIQPGAAFNKWREKQNSSDKLRLVSCEPQWTQGAWEEAVDQPNMIVCDGDIEGELDYEYRTVTYHAHIENTDSNRDGKVIFSISLGNLSYLQAEEIVSSGITFVKREGDSDTTYRITVKPDKDHIKYSNNGVLEIVLEDPEIVSEYLKTKAGRALKKAGEELEGLGRQTSKRAPFLRVPKATEEGKVGSTDIWVVLQNIPEHTDMSQAFHMKDAYTRKVQDDRIGGYNIESLVSDYLAECVKPQKERTFNPTVGFPGDHNRARRVARGMRRSIWWREAMESGRLLDPRKLLLWELRWLQAKHENMSDAYSSAVSEVKPHEEGKGEDQVREDPDEDMRIAAEYDVARVLARMVSGQAPWNEKYGEAIRDQEGNFVSWNEEEGWDIDNPTAEDRRQAAVAATLGICKQPERLKVPLPWELEEAAAITVEAEDAQRAADLPAEDDVPEEKTYSDHCRVNSLEVKPGHLSTRDIKTKQLTVTAELLNDGLLEKGTYACTLILERTGVAEGDNRPTEERVSFFVEDLARDEPLTVTIKGIKPQVPGVYKARMEMLPVNYVKGDYPTNTGDLWGYDSFCYGTPNIKIVGFDPKKKVITVENRGDLDANVLVSVAPVEHISKDDYKEHSKLGKETEAQTVTAGGGTADFKLPKVKKPGKGRCSLSVALIEEGFAFGRAAYLADDTGAVVMDGKSPIWRTKLLPTTRKFSRVKEYRQDSTVDTHIARPNEVVVQTEGKEGEKRKFYVRTTLHQKDSKPRSFTTDKAVEISSDEPTLVRIETHKVPKGRYTATYELFEALEDGSFSDDPSQLRMRVDNENECEAVQVRIVDSCNTGELKEGDVYWGKIASGQDVMLTSDERQFLRSAEQGGIDTEEIIAAIEGAARDPKRNTPKKRMEAAEKVFDRLQIAAHRKNLELFKNQRQRQLKEQKALDRAANREYLSTKSTLKHMSKWVATVIALFFINMLRRVVRRRTTNLPPRPDGSRRRRRPQSSQQPAPLQTIPSSGPAATQPQPEVSAAQPEASSETPAPSLQDRVFAALSESEEDASRAAASGNGTVDRGADAWLGSSVESMEQDLWMEQDLSDIEHVDEMVKPGEADGDGEWEKVAAQHRTFMRVIQIREHMFEDESDRSAPKQKGYVVGFQDWVQGEFLDEPKIADDLSGAGTNVEKIIKEIAERVKNEEWPGIYGVVFHKKRRASYVTPQVGVRLITLYEDEETQEKASCVIDASRIIAGQDYIFKMGSAGMGDREPWAGFRQDIGTLFDPKLLELMIRINKDPKLMGAQPGMYIRPEFDRSATLWPLVPIDMARQILHQLWNGFKEWMMSTGGVRGMLSFGVKASFLKLWDIYKTMKIEKSILVYLFKVWSRWQEGHIFLELHALTGTMPEPDEFEPMPGDLYRRTEGGQADAERDSLQDTVDLRTREQGLLEFHLSDQIHGALRSFMAVENIEMQLYLDEAFAPMHERIECIGSTMQDPEGNPSTYSPGGFNMPTMAPGDDNAVGAADKVYLLYFGSRKHKYGEGNRSGGIFAQTKAAATTAMLQLREGNIRAFSIVTRSAALADPKDKTRIAADNRIDRNADSEPTRRSVGYLVPVRLPSGRILHVPPAVIVDGFKFDEIVDPRLVQVWIGEESDKRQSDFDVEFTKMAEKYPNQLGSSASATGAIAAMHNALETDKAWKAALNIAKRHLAPVAFLSDEIIDRGDGYIACKVKEDEVNWREIDINKENPGGKVLTRREILTGTVRVVHKEDGSVAVYETLTKIFELVELNKAIRHFYERRPDTVGHYIANILYSFERPAEEEDLGEGVDLSLPIEEILGAETPISTANAMLRVQVDKGIRNHIGLMSVEVEHEYISDMLRLLWSGYFSRLGKTDDDPGVAASPRGEQTPILRESYDALSSMNITGVSPDPELEVLSYAVVERLGAGRAKENIGPNYYGYRLYDPEKDDAKEKKKEDGQEEEEQSSRRVVKVDGEDRHVIKQENIKQVDSSEVLVPETGIAIERATKEIRERAKTHTEGIQKATERYSIAEDEKGGTAFSIPGVRLGFYNPLSVKEALSTQAFRGPMNVSHIGGVRLMLTLLVYALYDPAEVAREAKRKVGMSRPKRGQYKRGDEGNDDYSRALKKYNHELAMKTCEIAAEHAACGNQAAYWTYHGSDDPRVPRMGPAEGQYGNSQKSVTGKRQSGRAITLGTPGKVRTGNAGLAGYYGRPARGRDWNVGDALIQGGKKEPGRLESHMMSVTKKGADADASGSSAEAGGEEDAEEVDVYEKMFGTLLDLCSEHGVLIEDIVMYAGGENEGPVRELQDGETVNLRVVVQEPGNPDKDLEMAGEAGSRIVHNDRGEEIAIEGRAVFDECLDVFLRDHFPYSQRVDFNVVEFDVESRRRKAGREEDFNVQGLRAQRVTGFEKFNQDWDAGLGEGEFDPLNAQHNDIFCKWLLDNTHLQPATDTINEWLKGEDVTNDGVAPDKGRISEKDSASFKLFGIPVEINLVPFNLLGRRVHLSHQRFLRGITRLLRAIGIPVGRQDEIQASREYVKELNDEEQVYDTEGIPEGIGLIDKTIEMAKANKGLEGALKNTETLEDFIKVIEERGTSGYKKWIEERIELAHKKIGGKQQLDKLLQIMNNEHKEYLDERGARITEAWLYRRIGIIMTPEDIIENIKPLSKRARETGSIEFSEGNPIGSALVEAWEEMVSDFRDDDARRVALLRALNILHEERTGKEGRITETDLKNAINDASARFKDETGEFVVDMDSEAVRTLTFLLMQRVEQKGFHYLSQDMKTMMYMFSPAPKLQRFGFFDTSRYWTCFGLHTFMPGKMHFRAPIVKRPLTPEKFHVMAEKISVLALRAYAAMAPNASPLSGLNRTLDSPISLSHGQLVEDGKATIQMHGVPPLEPILCGCWNNLGSMFGQGFERLQRAVKGISRALADRQGEEMEAVLTAMNTTAPDAQILRDSRAKWGKEETDAIATAAAVGGGGRDDPTSFIGLLENMLSTESIQTYGDEKIMSNDHAPGWINYLPFGGTFKRFLASIVQGFVPGTGRMWWQWTVNKHRADRIPSYEDMKRYVRLQMGDVSGETWSIDPNAVISFAKNYSKEVVGEALRWGIRSLSKGQGLHELSEEQVDVLVNNGVINPQTIELWRAVNKYFKAVDPWTVVERRIRPVDDSWLRENAGEYHWRDFSQEQALLGQKIIILKEEAGREMSLYKHAKSAKTGRREYLEKAPVAGAFLLNAVQKGISPFSVIFKDLHRLRKAISKRSKGYEELDKKMSAGFRKVLNIGLGTIEALSTIGEYVLGAGITVFGAWMMFLGYVGSMSFAFGKLVGMFLPWLQQFASSTVEWGLGVLSKAGADAGLLAEQAVKAWQFIGSAGLDIYGDIGMPLQALTAVVLALSFWRCIAWAYSVLVGVGLIFVNLTLVLLSPITKFFRYDGNVNNDAAFMRWKLPRNLILNPLAVYWVSRNFLNFEYNQGIAVAAITFTAYALANVHQRASDNQSASGNAAGDNSARAGAIGRWFADKVSAVGRWFADKIIAAGRWFVSTIYEAKKAFNKALRENPFNLIGWLITAGIITAALAVNWAPVLIASLAPALGFLTLAAFFVAPDAAILIVALVAWSFVSAKALKPGLDLYEKKKEELLSSLLPQLEAFQRGYLKFKERLFTYIPPTAVLILATAFIIKTLLGLDETFWQNVPDVYRRAIVAVFGETLETSTVIKLLIAFHLLCKSLGIIYWLVWWPVTRVVNILKGAIRVGANLWKTFGRIGRDDRKYRMQDRELARAKRRRLSQDAEEEVVSEEVEPEEPSREALRDQLEPPAEEEEAQEVVEVRIEDAQEAGRRAGEALAERDINQRDFRQWSAKEDVREDKKQQIDEVCAKALEDAGIPQDALVGDAAREFADAIVKIVPPPLPPAPAASTTAQPPAAAAPPRLTLVPREDEEAPPAEEEVAEEPTRLDRAIAAANRELAETAAAEEALAVEDARPSLDEELGGMVADVATDTAPPAGEESPFRELIDKINAEIAVGPSGPVEAVEPLPIEEGEPPFDLDAEGEHIQAQLDEVGSGIETLKADLAEAKAKLAARSEEDAAEREATVSDEAATRDFLERVTRGQPEPEPEPELASESAPELINPIADRLGRFGILDRVGQQEIFLVYIVDGKVTPRQGYKIHISATRESIGDVLEAVLPVLLAEEATFKVVDSLDSLGEMNSDDVQQGKIITVYPELTEEEADAGSAHKPSYTDSITTPRATDLATKIDQALMDAQITQASTGAPEVPGDKKRGEAGMVYSRYGSLGGKELRDYQDNGGYYDDRNQYRPGFLPTRVTMSVEEVSSEDEQTGGAEAAASGRIVALFGRDDRNQSFGFLNAEEKSKFAEWAKSLPAESRSKEALQALFSTFSALCKLAYEIGPDSITEVRFVEGTSNLIMVGGGSVDIDVTALHDEERAKRDFRDLLAPPATAMPPEAAVEETPAAAEAIETEAESTPPVDTRVLLADHEGRPSPIVESIYWNPQTQEIEVWWPGAQEPQYVVPYEDLQSQPATGRHFNEDITYAVKFVILNRGTVTIAISRGTESGEPLGGTLWSHTLFLNEATQASSIAAEQPESPPAPAEPSAPVEAERHAEAGEEVGMIEAARRWVDAEEKMRSLDAEEREGVEGEIRAITSRLSLERERLERSRSPLGRKDRQEQIRQLGLAADPAENLYDFNTFKGAAVRMSRHAEGLKQQGFDEEIYQPFSELAGDFDNKDKRQDGEIRGLVFEDWYREPIEGTKLESVVDALCYMPTEYMPSSFTGGGKTVAVATPTEILWVLNEIEDVETLDPAKIAAIIMVRLQRAPRYYRADRISANFEDFIELPAFNKEPYLKLHEAGGAETELVAQVAERVRNHFLEFNPALEAQLTWLIYWDLLMNAANKGLMTEERVVNLDQVTRPMVLARILNLAYANHRVLPVALSDMAGKHKMGTREYELMADMLAGIYDTTVAVNDIVRREPNLRLRPGSLREPMGRPQYGVNSERVVIDVLSRANAPAQTISEQAGGLIGTDKYWKAAEAARQARQASAAGDAAGEEETVGVDEVRKLEREIAILGALAEAAGYLPGVEAQKAEPIENNRLAEEVVGSAL